MKTVEQTIYEMLIENTGTHMLDSGGANGRNWQKNQNLKLEDFKNQPSATAEIYLNKFKGEISPEILPTVNVFHLLSGGALELCKYCHEFNSLPVKDWDGDFWGVSKQGENWLLQKGFEVKGDGFNTYNWASNHSQILQGQELKLNGGSNCIDGGDYVLLQIHGGADARGGYTDAKLFKLDDHAEIYCVYNEDCGFSVELKDIDIETPDIFTGEKRNNLLSLDWRCEWINEEGGCADDDDLLKFAIASGATTEKSVTISGDAYLDF